ncbi:MAG: hypothetical protein IPJ88_08195 [Myxococcales bacterium]|nr:MAG: hypothetical protein IPJ88_08195 [Myxococcales bacterium]
MVSDLAGRCGSCSYFIPLHTDESGRSSDKCRLTQGGKTLPETATCSSYKAFGSAWNVSSKKKSATHRHAAMPAAVKRVLPKEIGIDMDTEEFREVLRDVLREELGLDDVDLAERWRGGSIVLKPGKEGVQEKEIPLDALFHKVVMIRDKLRVLESKINANKKLTDGEKVQLQQYVTGCYGSLTTFNVLFRDRDSGFVGQRTKE